jgi:hypothetical protein
MIIYENKFSLIKKWTLNFETTETGSNELRFGRFKN